MCSVYCGEINADIKLMNAVFALTCAAITDQNVTILTQFPKQDSLFIKRCSFDEVSKCLTIVSGSPMNCPAGYTWEEPLCLKGIVVYMRRYPSSLICEADGATHPIFRSREMEEKVVNFMGSIVFDEPSFWLGLAFDLDVNKLKWDTHEEFMPEEYDKFQTNHLPNISKPCSVYSNGKWYTYYCHWDRLSICMAWSFNVKPLRVSSMTDPDIDGIYYPENGILLNGAPVYKQLSSSGTSYLLRSNISAREYTYCSYRKQSNTRLCTD